jgi:protein-disulfide isomerase
MRSNIGSTAIAVLGSLGLAGAAFSQHVPADELRKEMQELRDALKGVTKELRDIKELLGRLPAPMAPINPVVRPAPPSAVDQVIDLAGSPFQGPAAAKVTLIEFSDYQCPFCARYFRETYPEIREQYVKSGKVKSVFVDLPLESIHRLAFKAAEAAACAGEQSKYWEMHDRLFANQTALEPWNGHAQALDLNVTAFEQCLTEAKFAARIRKDLGEAQRLGVTGTPTVLLGRTDPNSSRIRISAVVSGAQPFAEFKREIDRLLADSAR